MRIALAQIRSGTEPSANLSQSRTTHAAPPTRAPTWCCSRRRRCAGLGAPCSDRGAIGRTVGVGGARGSRSATASSLWRACSPGGRTARVTNTLIATGPGVDAHYDKIYLYDAFGVAESRTVAPGHEPTVIAVDEVVGLSD